MKKQILSLCIAGATLALSGCDNKPAESSAEVKAEKATPEAPAKPDFELKAITRAAWLREQLPENAFFYARVPSFWGLASYKNDVFKEAHGNPAYRAEIEKIRTASAAWFKKGEADVTTLLTLVGSQMDGPLEMAAYSIENQPQLLITAQVRFQSEAELQALIDLFKRERAVRKIIEPMKEGAGVVMTDGAPVAYQWDQLNGRLNMQVTMTGATPDSLRSAFTGLKANPASPMLSNEQRMDDSHRGLYVWFDNQTATPVYTPILPPDAALPMAAAGVPQMQSLAASWGVSNGKGRLKFELNAPSESMVRQFLPANKNSYPIKTAGTPGMVLSLSLPSYNDFKRLEMMAGGLSNPEYQEQKKKLTELLGYPLDDWFKAIGPEMVLVSDKAGEYLAIRLREPETFNNILDVTKAWPGSFYESRQINGQTIHHLKLRSMYSSAKDEMEKGNTLSPLLTDLMTEVGSHLYWKQEGDFMILTDLPQVLFDREAMLSERTLEQWLREEQRQDISGSTLAFSGNIRNAPRRIYYFYLNGLQALGDLTNANQDMFGLPSAGQLQLADKGTYGIQLDSSKDKLAMEMVFESSPADLVLAGEGAGTIAAVGIMAAIALPAYQDYTKRAYISQAYFESHTMRSRVEAFYAEHGRYPNADEAADFYAEYGDSYHYIELEADTGVLQMTLSGNSGDFYDDLLSLHPEHQHGLFSWYCGGDIETKYLPSSCR